MVVPRWLGALMLMAAMPGAAAITPAQLHALVRAAAAVNQARARRLHPGDLAALLPPASGERTGGEVSHEMPRSQPGALPRNPVPAPKRMARLAAPARQTLYSDAVMPDRRHPFGIRLGTWVQARLPTRVSSVDPGLVELVVSRAVHGSWQTLAAGTLLFCRQELNSAARRLELLAVKGITPSGLEFRMQGRVFDTARIPGLAGMMTRDPAGILRRSASAGALAAGGNAVGGLVAQGGAGATAAAAAGGSLLSAAGRWIGPADRRRSIIYVAPQPVLVRVTATF